MPCRTNSDPIHHIFDIFSILTTMMSSGFPLKIIARRHIYLGCAFAIINSLQTLMNTYPNSLKTNSSHPLCASVVTVYLIKSVSPFVTLLVLIQLIQLILLILLIQLIQLMYVLNVIKGVNRIYINSLLPLGRYIDMDPCTTELVVSQTQIIRFGQFLLG